MRTPVEQRTHAMWRRIARSRGAWVSILDVADALGCSYWIAQRGCRALWQHGRVARQVRYGSVAYRVPPQERPRAAWLGHVPAVPPTTNGH